MPLAVHTRETRDQRCEAVYDAWQQLRLQTDEVTQASEQLNGAMENVFTYRLAGDELYFQGQALTPIFERGVETAQQLMTRAPEFTVEYLRRCIERRQLSEQISLCKNTDLSDPEVLIHISPTPDVVLDGSVRLNAYDRERKKIMIRLTEPTAEGVRVTSISLDGNDRLGLQAIGDFCGLSIPDDATSEDILAMSGLVRRQRFGGRTPSQVIREQYDQALVMQYGGRWYGGRPEQASAVIHTLDRIMGQPGIIREHMAVVTELQRRHGKTFRETADYKRANRNFLAAIHYASHEETGFAGSLSDAGAMADSEGVRFSQPDCPTDVSAEQALAEQGIGESKEMKCVTCPFCGRTVDATVSGGVISCPACYKAVDKKGNVFDSRLAASQPERAEKSVSKAPSKPSLHRLAQQAFAGVDVEVRFVLGIGGGDNVIYDKHTGSHLATITDGTIVLTSLTTTA